VPLSPIEVAAHSRLRFGMFSFGIFATVWLPRPSLRPDESL
jgi:hypothetical protein